MMTPKVRIAWLIGKINRTIIILSLYRSILKNKRKVNIDDKAQQLGISAAEIFLDIILWTIQMDIDDITYCRIKCAWFNNEQNVDQMVMLVWGR